MYNFFNKIILRTPIDSFNANTLNDIDLFFFVNQSIFLQSIRLASPSLYSKFEKWQSFGLKNKKEEERLFQSLLKYYIRSNMRCTPFGLFAGISIGQIADNTEIIINSKETHLPHTRLDMNYLCSLIQDIEKLPEIRERLTYYNNNSLYKINDKIRYVEFTYYNSNRKHQISAVENNQYLEKVLNYAKNGATKKELINVLIDNEISFDDATLYIDQLIDNQLLVSSLDATVTGMELHDFLINKIKTLSLLDQRIYEILYQVKQEIIKLDNLKLGEGINMYSKISNQLKEIDIKFEEKYLFQTDLNIITILNNIDKSIIYNLLDGINILNKLTNKSSETNLTKFRDAFYERYEDKEVPLPLALDTEAGIGYLQNNSDLAGDNTPLIDDVILPSSPNSQQSYNIRWDKKQSFLLKKYLTAIKENQKIVEINDSDVKDFNVDWNDLPPTIFAMTELVKINQEVNVIISSVGGSSAINLLGRFAHTNKEIETFINEIVNKEQELSPDIILAEIAHLPESRVGNVLARPVFREFEIPYLAQSSVEKEFQIQIEDLMISVRNNKIVLRSKKHNKIVKPHLSNAHNFSTNALPVYQFLGDMQTQDLRVGLFFNWGNLGNEYNFFPRVMYKNIIFSLAKWVVKKEEIESILKSSDNKKMLEEFSQFCKLRNIPKDVVLADGDNELYINLKNNISVKMLLSIVKQRNSFELKEFLFSDKDGIVKDLEGNFYTNEVIFSFYKNIENKV